MLRRSEHAGGEVVRFRLARTVLGQPLYVGGCYLVGGALLDAGPPNQARALHDALRHERVEAVLVSHGHEDHFGGAAGLDAPVYAAPGVQLAHHIPFYRRVTWGEPAPTRVLPVPEALEVGGLEFQPLPTPGHTRDHLAYWAEERGWLFAGDAALGPLKYGMRGEDLGAYMASLRKMRDLKPAVVFPAHGPVLDQPDEQLGAQLAHLEGLKAGAEQLAREGLSDAAIARRLLGRDGWLGWASRGEFSKERLVRGLRGA